MPVWTQSTPQVRQEGTERVFVALYPGATIAAKVTAALAAIPAGGIISLRGLSGTVDSFTIDKDCIIELGVGTYTISSGSTITVQSKNITIRGASPGETIVSAATGCTTMFTFAAGQTTGEGKTLTVFERFTMDGLSHAQYGFFAPNRNAGSPAFKWDGGTHVWQDMFLRGFTSWAIWIGDSDYFNYMDRLYVVDNAGGVHTGQNSDCCFFRCVMGRAGASALIDMDGAQQRILGCTFTGGGGTGTGPDINIGAGTATTGTIVIDDCYFGNEGETAVARRKIVCDGAASGSGAGRTARVNAVKIKNSFLYGMTGQNFAIELFNPIQGWDIDGNSFEGFGTVINDVQSPATVAIPGEGNSNFGANNRVGPNAFGTQAKVFANGGRDFGAVVYPPGSGGITLPWVNNGTKQNRIRSEDYTAAVDGYSWSYTTSTITTGQTDPFGTTKAAKFSVSSAVGAVLAKWNATSLLTDDGSAASGANGRVVVAEWFKAGTITNGDAVIYDLTAAVAVSVRRITMASVWKREEFVVCGLDPTHIYRLYFYPNGDGSAGNTGDYYISHPQVSDYGGIGSYAVGTGTAVVSSGALAP